MEGEANWDEGTIRYEFKHKGQEPTQLSPRLVSEAGREEIFFSCLLCCPSPQQLVWIQISICTLGSQFLLEPAPAPSEVHPSLIFT